MKELIKQKTGEIKEHSSHVVNRKQFEITKRINPLYAAIGLITYTALVVIGTGLIFEKENSHENNISYNLFKEEILLEIKKNKPQIVKSGSSTVQIKNELEIMRKELLSEVNRLNISYLEMIDKDKKKTVSVIKDIIKRNPTSIAKGNGRTLVFNQANKSTLWYKHNQAYDRLKEKLKEQKQNILISLNLKNSNDLEKLKLLEDKNKLALYELKQNQYAERKKFEKDGYLILSE